jgi:fructokinase
MELGRPIVFGEMVFDRYPDGSRRLGGAPLNVAVHLAALGADPLLISRVGRDASGERALLELSRHELDTSGVQVDLRRPTGRIDVDLTGEEPRFEVAEPAAFDAIDAGAAVEACEDENAAILYHGVLAARAERSRRALFAVRAAVPVPRVVDVNLRPPWTPVERALDLAQGAAWLKMNRSELGELLEREPSESEAELAVDARGLLFRVAASALVVTDSAHGARLFANGGARERVGATPLDPAQFVDSVGAGDAFAAVLVYGALAGWPADRTLRRAAALAGEICTIEGALPDDAAFYVPFRDAWGLAA